jgi:hypothetical protein
MGGLLARPDGASGRGRGASARGPLLSRFSEPNQRTEPAKSAFGLWTDVSHEGGDAIDPNWPWSDPLIPLLRGIDVGQLPGHLNWDLMKSISGFGAKITISVTTMAKTK